MSREIIKKLLTMYKTKDILTDEVKFDFNSLKKPHEVYGVPEDMPKGYLDGPFNHPFHDQNVHSQGQDPILNQQNGPQ